MYKQTTHSSIQIHLFVNSGARLRSQTRSTTLSYSTRASQAQKKYQKNSKNKNENHRFFGGCGDDTSAAAGRHAKTSIEMKTHRYRHPFKHAHMQTQAHSHTFGTQADNILILKIKTTTIIKKKIKQIK